MKHECIKAIKLPDVEIYAGDTTPWQITLVRENGALFVIEQGATCTATFTMVRVRAAGLPGDTEDEILLSKTGTFQAAPNGGTIAIFDFEEADTKELYGKFLYQIEIRHIDDLRIGQGDLYIKHNINQ